MKKVCENDGVEFEAKRATAKFCSAKCRVEAARAIGVDPDTGEVQVPSAQAEESKLEPKSPLPVGAVANQMGGITGSAPNDLEARAAKIGITPEEYMRRLRGFEKMGLSTVNWITTGIPELDAFQQIPRGRVTQIQGPFAVGKTTLALNMIKGLKGKKVFYIDSEASLNPQLLLDLELDPNEFHLYNESAYIEDMYDQVILAAKGGSYDMIIIDSLAACTTKTEESGAATDRNIGQKALIVNKLCRIVPMMLKDSDTALVIINQEREVIGSYVPQKYTPGGMGPVYAASLILALKTIPSWRFPKDAKNGAYKGHEIEVTVAKSKVSNPHRKAKIKLHYISNDLVKDYQPEELSDAEAF